MAQSLRETRIHSLLLRRISVWRNDLRVTTNPKCAPFSESSSNPAQSIHAHFLPCAPTAYTIPTSWSFMKIIHDFHNRASNAEMNMCSCSIVIINKPSYSFYSCVSVQFHVSSLEIGIVSSEAMLSLFLLVGKWIVVDLRTSLDRWEFNSLSMTHRYS